MRTGRRERRPLPRRHLLLLVLITVVGLLRGLYWVSVTLTFSPVDEGAHYAYVESMARDLRPPVVGRDRLSADALRIVKGTRTSEWRVAPVPPSPDDDRWGAVRESYEGVQGPPYYALMAVPFLLGRSESLLGSLYAVRVASVLLSLVAVPLAYALARELFPRRQEVWLAAPAVLVLLQGFNGNLASVTADALVVPVAGAALLAVACARRLGLTPVNGVATGALLGLGVATKSNMIALVPLVGAIAIGVALLRRERWKSVLVWGTACSVASLLVVLPWLVWNLATYGALSASHQVDLITGPFQPEFPFSFEGIRRHLVLASIGYWDFQLVARPLGRYMWTMSVVAAAMLSAAVAVSLVRRRRRQAAVLAWLGSTWFVTLAFMLTVIYVVFGGRSSVIGRHLYPSLVAVVVLVAGAAFVVAGRRLGWLLLVVLANLALTFEQPTVHVGLAAAYTDGLIGSLVPVVEQGYADTTVRSATVRLSSPCPAEAIALAFPGQVPPSLRVRTAGGVVDAPKTRELPSVVQGWSVYSLPAPVTGAIEVQVPDVDVNASVAERERRVSFVGRAGDPAARVYCPSDDPRAARFAQVFAPDHPGWITYGLARAWPVAWAWAARIVLVGLVAWIGLREVSRIRRQRSVRETTTGPASAAGADAESVRAGAG